MEIATLAGGCFWCTEAIFKRLKGVKTVLPGYSGGEIINPTYEQVSSGDSGHAEVIQIEFDPKVIEYKKILEIFFYTHDPTTPNQQGNDIGPQYRSVIFYHNEKQKNISIEYIDFLTKNKKLLKPIVTTVEEFKNFYLAEDYHKNYFDRNRDKLYCSLVIDPKIKKLLSRYSEEIADEYKSD